MLFGYYVWHYFCTNVKKYITVTVAVLFFFISTSFTTPEKSVEEDIYLSQQSGNVNIFEEEVTLAEEASDLDVANEKVVLEENDFDIISTELLSKEDEIELEDTENIDTFSLEDFLLEFSEDDVVQYENSELSGFDKDAWYLTLVNKTHPVPDDYEVKLTKLSGSMQCDERVKDVLLDMLNAASKENIKLIVCSPYRDYELQERLFEKKVNNYLSYGNSYMDAYKLASKAVIVPGASEHQLGIAFDIVTDYYRSLNIGFGETEAAKWLKKHCAEFGFILRYPKDKGEITGIMYEPWHFRYVGVEAATYIMENDLTLEEFWEDL